ncbi:hypothetical protein [Microbacterium trichothecenolyticum]|uniref:Uncharacterized protein n=1 Tax=Microbacterium trichothecenolyticum TaxID=69370 RepID=A0A0M2H8C4_MICTR|nr:hypothetical protein [Microbacterium trichothecenolyticum]KJL40816.1 hypothetical protein RS82_03432 [Microbacterium trichothecenolyticum]
MNSAASSRAQRRAQAAFREAYRRDVLGSATARRRVIAKYRGDDGWQPVKGVRLDDESAQAFMADGVTLVRVRRRGREIEVGLRRYLG